MRTSLAPAIEELVVVIARIHAERPIAVSSEIASELAAAVDPQDLDEMLGNLLDNAWKHAHSAIAVRAILVGRDVELTIEDDGSGLSEDALGEAVVPGHRLDERGDRHGFGLSIVTELAELNGGGLTLGRSLLMGGLQATLTLPNSLKRS